MTFYYLKKTLFIGLLIACCLVSGIQAGEFEFSYELSGQGNLQPANWQLRLEFNQPVSVIEISKNVSLKFNNQKQSFKIYNATQLGADEEKKPLSSERRVFIIQPQKPATQPGECEITINKKLAANNQKAQLKKERKISFKIATGTTLLGHEPFFYSADNKGVRIFLSDNVKDYQLKRKIRIFPPVGVFKVNRQYSRTRNEYKITGKFVTGQNYKVELLGEPLGEKGAVLHGTSFTFTAKGPEPQIRFATDRSVLELNSRQLIPLTFANVGDFKCQLMKVPAYFSPWLDSLTAFPEVEEKRPTDSGALKIDGSVKKIIDETAADLDNLMLQCVNRLAAIRALKGTEKIPGLTEFLTPEFSSRSEGYMGSDDPDKEFYFSLPLDFRPKPTIGGSVIVRVNESEVENGQQATRLFQLTDMSISYKFSQSELLLWVTSIETGKPLSNASVMLMLKNDTTLFPGKTDKNGILKIDNKTEYPGIKWQLNTPAIVSVTPKINDLLIAAVANLSDSSFIRLNTNRILPYAATMASPDQKSTMGAKAKIFTERGIYRQNETVYWKTVVREYADKNIKPLSEEEVNITVSDARGEEIYSEAHKLNQFGTCSGSLQLTAYAPLGNYNIRVKRQIPATDDQSSNYDADWDFLMNRDPEKTSKSATNKSKPRTITLSAASFQVQEFEPPRHYINIETSLETRKVKMIVGRETEQPYLRCTIKSLYYTGGPVRHAKLQWTAHLTEADRSESQHPLYQFGNNESFKDLIESGNSVLDKNGELSIAIPVSQAVLSGLNSIEISATALDVDARPATAVSRFSHKPEFKVGIARLPSSLTQGQEFPVHVMVLDQDGNKISRGEIQLEILRKKWFYTQKRDASGGIYYRWDSGWMRNQTAKRPINNQRAEFDLILAEGGDYMLQASYRHQNKEYQSAYSFSVDYSFASFSDMNNKNRQRSENEVILLPDKLEAQINEKVKVRFSLPEVCEYALITKETDEILEARVVKLGKAQGEFYENIGEDCRPNTYIGLLAPSRRNSFPVYTSQIDSDYPRTYFGFTNIKVQNKIEKMKLDIAPQHKGALKARPAQLYDLRLKIADKAGRPADAEVAVCVVDEAVLSLTGYVTPVLNSLADFILPLSVFTGDLRTSLISQELYRLLSNSELTGGDGGGGAITADLDLRKDFRPVAFWHPALYPDSNGEINISFKLPDSMTSYRIYAVAVDKNSAFSSEERQLVVSKEFYLEPGLPRFLTVGDKAVFPVNFYNKSDEQGMVSCQILQAENLTLTPIQQETELKPFTNSLMRFAMHADNSAGDSRLIFSGKFNGYEDAIERVLPVNPAATIINRHLGGSFTENQSLNPEIPGYVKALSDTYKTGTLKAQLNISANQWSRIIPSLEYLLKYPYGCLEQTSSAIIPLAAMRQLIKEGQLPQISIDRVDQFLKKGINRLLEMQDAAGSFSYWPGSMRESWWGTQYAALALTMAKKSGFVYDYKCLDKAVAAIRTGLFSRSNTGHFSQGIMALAAVNLAMNTEIKPADMKMLKQKFAGTSNEANALLLLAEALNPAGSNKSLQARLNKLKPVMKSVSRSWQYSSTRENAFALMAILTGKADKKQADDFAGQLLNSIGNKGYWHSTADTGIALLALSQYFTQYSQKAKSNPTITIKTAGEEQKIELDKYGSTIEISAADLLSGKGIQLNSSNDTLLSYSLAYSYPDKPDRTQEIIKGFIIDKTIKNLNGKDKIQVGDLIKVTIEFEDKYKNDDHFAILHYLALEDPIPAGFIAVNSSLKNDSLPASEIENEEAYCGWREGAYDFYADHQELHNDKLLAFKNRFWSGRFRLVYYLRAVCEGEFAMKPTRISLMYDPEFYGMSNARRIKIEATGETPGQSE
jgi:uncharacterized protein YfaS (alpha-2-macroglobulin family)